jgi:dienelactone hydrolase
MGRRFLGSLAIVLGLVLGLAPAASATPKPNTGLGYRRLPVHVTQHSVQRRGAALVRDISYQVSGQPAVSAYLVTPLDAGRHPATMFLHWLAEPAVSNRGEFLDEAVGLAQHGMVALLPQLVFPITVFPVGNSSDRASIVAQAVQLRRGLDLLDARNDVDRHRVAVVGHDYGAMYATLLGSVDRHRIAALVVMAADATWANWFVLYFLDLPADQVPAYQRLFHSLDPINRIGCTSRPLLLQYATNDVYIPSGVMYAMASAAGARTTFDTYDTDHALAVPAALADRDAFLRHALRF